MLENYGNVLVKIQYAYGGVGEVSTKEIVHFVHNSLVEADDQDSSLIKQDVGRANKSVETASKMTKADETACWMQLDQDGDAIQLEMDFGQTIGSVDNKWSLLPERDFIDLGKYVPTRTGFLG